jgi:16S rRNA A1518/A1519 N6-dimethyltransferase RsmA/KsgA/DIM1 with predicted DNA glycosylase/AP lyase activity
VLLIIPEKVKSLATVKLRVAAPSAASAAKVNIPVFVPSPSVTSAPIVIEIYNTIYNFTHHEWQILAVTGKQIEKVVTKKICF